jgi:predicted lipoprotein with Yx(FWY)xxD motif
MRTHFQLALLFTAALLPTVPASAASMVTAENGMTVYVFDKDAGGVSACYDACAKTWPAYTAKDGAKKAEGWATAKRKDGAMQWTYDGKPLYFYAPDKKKGDMAGDGIGGIWHIVSE